MTRIRRSLTVAFALSWLSILAAGTPAAAADDDDPPSPEERCWEAYQSRVESCIMRYGLEAEGKIDPAVRRMAAEACIEAAGETLRHCLDQAAGESGLTSQALNGGVPLWIEAGSPVGSETLVVDLEGPAADGTVLRLAGSATVDVVWDDRAPWPGFDAARLPAIEVPPGTRRILLRARRVPGTEGPAWVAGMLQTVDPGAPIRQN